MIVNLVTNTSVMLFTVHQQKYNFTTVPNKLDTDHKSINLHITGCKAMVFSSYLYQLMIKKTQTGDFAKYHKIERVNYHN